MYRLANGSSALHDYIDTHSYKYLIKVALLKYYCLLDTDFRNSGVV